MATAGQNIAPPELEVRAQRLLIFLLFLHLGIHIDRPTQALALSQTFPFVYIPQVPNQAQGAEYGLPSTQVKGDQGAVTVSVPKSVADRFESVVEHSGGGSSQAPVFDEKHKSGMEPVTERARNLTEVTEAKVQSGGEP